MMTTKTEIVLAGGLMPFGPNSLQFKALGGSETAMLMMAKELKRDTTIVTVFTNLPPQGHPDYIASGTIDEQGIRWCSMDLYPQFIQHTDVDLLVAWRFPQLLQMPLQAKWSVLWLHDLATFNDTAPQLGMTAWNFNEIWTVSEWHRQQVHKVTGFPLSHIWATRNGIVPIDTVDMGQVQNQLIYASRPERGLEQLVKPGGIMERLPEYNLKVAMYDHVHPAMENFYNYLMQRCHDLPNVEVVGALTQQELRQLMANSSGYVYPSDFEDTSNIVARECISVHLPFFTTKQTGALPETLGNCGFYVEDWQDENRITNSDPAAEFGSPVWCQDFAEMVRSNLNTEGQLEALWERMSKRDDLKWDTVADDWLQRYRFRLHGRDYDLLRSLVEDSDLYPFRAYVEVHEDELRRNPWTAELIDRTRKQYPMVWDDIGYADYYKNYYDWQDEIDPMCRGRNPLEFNIGERLSMGFEEISKLPAGSKVLDYGCAHGSVLIVAAKMFPHLEFYGVDFETTNIKWLEHWVKENGLTNVHGTVAEHDKEFYPGEVFDYGIVSEVLEHCAKPWEVAAAVEKRVKIGGRMYITVPQGPWEALGIYQLSHWDKFRNHVWHIDKSMIRQMFADKKEGQLRYNPVQIMGDMHNLGHCLYSYTVDHGHVYSVDAYSRAVNHRSREWATACVIAMNNEDTILKMLRSIAPEVACVSIALGPCTDNTSDRIEDFKRQFPWVQVRVTDVPKIEAGKFGFDDARNASVEGVATEWVLWIDTDEYYAGTSFRKFLRPSAMDSLAIHQHHFSVEPRGAPAQLDKPARLYRRSRGFKFYGKIHEHAEVELNKGPGYCMIIPDADIGHTGYVNEAVRRSRFERNWPLLQWDHEVGADRRLHSYLWLRDCIHRMRYCHEIGNIPAAQKLAQEALDWYDAKWKDLEVFGQGVIQGLGYVGEARAYLNKGSPISVQITIEDHVLAFETRAERIEDVTKVVESMTRPELEKRSSKYWIKR